MNYQLLQSKSIWRQAFIETYLPMRAKDLLTGYKSEEELDLDTFYRGKPLSEVELKKWEFYDNKVSDVAHFLGLPFEPINYKGKPLEASWTVLWWNVAGLEPDARGWKKGLNLLTALPMAIWHVAVALLILPKNIAKLFTEYAGYVLQNIADAKAAHYLVKGDLKNVRLASIRKGVPLVFFVLLIVLGRGWWLLGRATFSPLKSMQAALRTRGIVYIHDGIRSRHSWRKTIPAWSLLALSVAVTLSVWGVAAPVFFTFYALPYLPALIAAEIIVAANFLKSAPILGSIITLFGPPAVASTASLGGLATLSVYKVAEKGHNMVVNTDQYQALAFKSNGEIVSENFEALAAARAKSSDDSSCSDSSLGDTTNEERSAKKAAASKSRVNTLFLNSSSSHFSAQNIHARASSQIDSINPVSRRNEPLPTNSLRRRGG